MVESISDSDGVSFFILEILIASSIVGKFI